MSVVSACLEYAVFWLVAILEIFTVRVGVMSDIVQTVFESLGLYSLEIFKIWAFK